MGGRQLKKNDDDANGMGATAIAAGNIKQCLTMEIDVFSIQILWDTALSNGNRSRFMSVIIRYFFLSAKKNSTFFI